jgi:hypothetical protein
MGGFNTFLFNLITFNGIFSSTITRSGGSPIDDRISIYGVALELGTSPSLPNGFNSNSFNTLPYNGASYTGSSGENTVTTNENEIMRISIAKG